MLTSNRSAAAAVFSLAAALSAQCPPGAPMPRDIALATQLPATGPAQSRLQTGLAALASGNQAEARGHFYAALEFHPSSTDLLLELACACGDDHDLLAQWL